MMKIYIAMDHDDNPISLILADDNEKAAIAFMGMGLTPGFVEELDPSKSIGMHGVAFLLTSTETSVHDLPRSFDRTVRIWKRGL